MLKNGQKLENEFIKLVEELTGGKFYIPTDEHSSGFNEVEIYEVESNNSYKMYNVEEENNADKSMTFDEVISKYPTFTLSKRLAFNGEFETWTRYEKALNGEIKINIIEL